jgi:hypothetical protein
VNWFYQTVLIIQFLPKHNEVTCVKGLIVFNIVDVCGIPDDLYGVVEGNWETFRVKMWEWSAGGEITNLKYES